MNPTRDEILASVAAVFARDGFEAATVRELGKAAGVSQGTLYYHIGSKQDALLEISNAFVDVMIDRLTEVHDSQICAEAKLRSFIAVMLDTVVTNRTNLALFLRERRSLPADAQSAIREKSDRIDRILRDILAEGAEAGAWHQKVPLQAVRLAIFGIVSWAVEWFDIDGPKSHEDFADAFTRLILNGIVINNDHR